MEVISQKFYSWCIGIADQSKMITLGILIIVTLVISISLMCSKEARENAKKWIPWVLIGAGGALSAVTIATAIGNSMKF